MWTLIWLLLLKFWVIEGSLERKNLYIFSFFKLTKLLNRPRKTWAICFRDVTKTLKLNKKQLISYSTLFTVKSSPTVSLFFYSPQKPKPKNKKRQSPPARKFFSVWFNLEKKNLNDYNSQVPFFNFVIRLIRILPRFFSKYNKQINCSFRNTSVCPI